MSDTRSSRRAPLMLVDVGNTNTIFGIHDGDRLVESFRLSTDRERTADEYGALLLPLFDRAGVDPTGAEAVVISSVVPPLHPTLELLAARYFHKEPMFIEPGIRTGMPIRYDNPAEVGADIITPGISISAEALFSHASRLYRVDIKKPDLLVGKNTAGAMQAGLYYGFIGLVDGILERLLDEMPDTRTVVATGGLAELIASGSEHIREVDQMLTLTGLKIIYDRNRRG
jgi:type III pantothenate kinase